MESVAELTRVVPESFENVKELYEAGKVMLDLKNCPVDLKTQAIKHALHLDNLEDPLMLLNILNLIKVYNTLDDSYFDSPDIYVNSVEELLDIKLALNTDIKAFSRQLSVYFLSIIKSFNKLTFTPADEHIELPSAYKFIILATDFLTISGIFAKAGTISTDELTYINNAYVYMTSLIVKSSGCTELMSKFYEGKEVVQ